MRDHFLGWQCRLRALAVRHDGGRPSPGMVPRLEVGVEEPVAGSLVVLIVEREPTRFTMQLRFVFQRTHDPRKRYEKGLELLSAGYFQHPSRFSDVMTALFSPDSPTANSLTRLGRCVLHFEQFSQYYRIPCTVRRLQPDDAAFQATYWHNSVFNPNLPLHPHVLAFRPLWARAQAEPPAS